MFVIPCTNFIGQVSLIGIAFLKASSCAGIDGFAIWRNLHVCIIWVIEMDYNTAGLELDPVRVDDLACRGARLFLTAS